MKANFAVPSIAQVSSPNAFAFDEFVNAVKCFRLCDATATQLVRCAAKEIGDGVDQWTGDHLFSSLFSETTRYYFVVREHILYHCRAIHAIICLAMDDTRDSLDILAEMFEQPPFQPYDGQAPPQQQPYYQPPQQQVEESELPQG